jgi:hypothetical protein
MNWADCSLVFTTFGCAFVAGTGAAAEKMGWASLLFAVGGLAIGFGFGLAAKCLANKILSMGARQSRPLYDFGLIVAYMLAPMIVLVAAIAGTMLLTIWLARSVI